LEAEAPNFKAQANCEGAETLTNQTYKTSSEIFENWQQLNKAK